MSHTPSASRRPSGQPGWPGRWPRGGPQSLAGFGIGAIVVTALLATALGLGIAPILVAGAVWLLIGLAVARGIDAHPHRDFGAANRVTTLRAAITAVLAGAVPVAATLDTAALWGISALALIALTLDGVDGWLARVQGRSSEFGARFDMETDALLALVMALLLWRTGEVGAWVLGLGLMRYLFIVAMRMQPELARPLFPSWRRKCVCVVQVATLAICLMPALAPPLSSWLLVAALGALLGSFLRDTHWLLHRRWQPA